jgi:peptidoglycan hydrolase CwlO-like protein
MTFKDVLTCLVAVTVLTGSAIGATRYFAKQTQLCMLEMRFDQKQLWDRQKDIQSRMWQFENEYGAVDNMPRSMQLEYWKLKDELKEVEYELDKLKREVR